MSKIQFFEKSALFSVDQSTSTDTSVVISGLAASSGVDRDGQQVSDPTQFDIPSFMASGRTLLLDHNFIKESDGNNSVAGKVVSAEPVEIIQIIEQGDEPRFVLRSLVREEIVATFEVSKAPNLNVSDKALFVTAEITHPFAIQKVINGELRSFSWSGFAKEVQTPSGITDLQEIDLVEISIVHMPSRKTSTFRILDDNHPDRELNFDEIEFVKMAFSKSEYDLDAMNRYTKTYKNTHIEEDANNYFITIGDSSLVDSSCMFGIPCGNRTIYAAPKIKKRIVEVPAVGILETQIIKENSMSDTTTQDAKVEEAVEVEQKQLVQLHAFDLETFKSLIPNFKLSTIKTAVLDAGTEEEVEAEINLIEFPVAEEVTEEVEAVEIKEEVKEVPEVVVESVQSEAAPVASETNDLQIQELTQAMGLIADKVGELSQNLQNTVSEAVEKKFAEQSAKIEKASKQTAAIADIAQRISGGASRSETPSQVSKSINKQEKEFEITSQLLVSRAGE